MNIGISQTILLYFIMTLLSLFLVSLTHISGFKITSGCKSQENNCQYFERKNKIDASFAEIIFKFMINMTVTATHLQRLTFSSKSSKSPFDKQSLLSSLRRYTLHSKNLILTKNSSLFKIFVNLLNMCACLNYS